MYEQDTSSMVQPTLCEVIYHGVEDNSVLLDDLYTPYRLRGLSGDTGRTSTAYGPPSYTDPTTVGYRTPPGFVVGVILLHKMK